METKDMVRMANQIATFFKSYGAEEGTKEVANHINNFWEPRMRAHFFDFIAKGNTGFDAMVLAAVPMIRKPADHHKPQSEVPPPGEEN
jgi:formate dehydrogenase subunit delta